jgi:hypothetical protein
MAGTRTELCDGLELKSAAQGSGALARLGYEVFSAGDQGPLEGEALTALLAHKGLRSVYLIAGPRTL